MRHRALRSLPLHAVLSRRILVFLTTVLLCAGASAGAVSAQDGTTTTAAPTPTTGAPTTSTTTTPPPPPTSLQLTGAPLAKGSNGLDVAFVQARLAQRGVFLQDSLGRFGEPTRHAVVAFQKFAGLPRTGRVDFWTRLALAVSTERLAPRSPQAGHSIDVDLGRQVLIIQTNGRTDGVFDISSGKPSTPTPRGGFRLTRQIRGLRVSDLGQLWQPKYFTGGYALHGSPSVPAYAASHGCVRMTNQEIDYLWSSGLAEIGTPVSLS